MVQVKPLDFSKIQMKNKFLKTPKPSQKKSLKRFEENGRKRSKSHFSKYSSSGNKNKAKEVFFHPNYQNVNLPNEQNFENIIQRPENNEKLTIPKSFYFQRHKSLEITNKNNKNINNDSEKRQRLKSFRISPISTFSPIKNNLFSFPKHGHLSNRVKIH